MGFIGILSAKTWAGLGAVVAVAAFLGWGAVTLRNSATEQCNQAHAAAQAEAAAADHADYLAAIAWGSQISAQLAQTQRRLNDVKTDYLAYAHGIAGNCPADLGVLIDAAARGKNLPAATGTPADPAATVAAAAVGANIAENYARCLANASQLSALVDWHHKTNLIQ